MRDANREVVIKKTKFDILIGLASIILTIFTGVYVALTYSLVKSQKNQLSSQEAQLRVLRENADNQEKQFTKINRPRVYLTQPVGGLGYGVFSLVNAGSFSAQDVKIIWKIVNEKNKQIIGFYPKPSTDGVVTRNILKADEDLKLNYKTTLSKDYEGFCFLLIAWKYKGEGTEGVVQREQIYVLDPQSKNIWLPNPNPFDQEQLQLIIDEQLKMQQEIMR